MAETFAILILMMKLTYEARSVQEGWRNERASSVRAHEERPLRIDVRTDGTDRHLTLENCVVFTSSEVLADGRIVIEDGRITHVGHRREVGPVGERVDLQGLTVTAGFVDLQVNGGGDVLFNEQPTLDALDTIVEAHALHGTTNMLPTFITGPVDGMYAARDAVLRYRAERGSALLGIHFEGPSISRDRLGVHDAQFTAAGFPIAFQVPIGMVVLITLAPEIVGVDIPGLVRAGAVVAVGHSNATFEQATGAISDGARCATHLFNAMSPLTGRQPGVVGAFLASDEAYVSIIADGHHCHFGSIRVAWNSKPRGRTILVSDAMPPVGGTRDHFRLGHRSVTVENGRCFTDTGELAGAALGMNTAVRNCVHHVGIPKEEAFRMASLYPAQLIGCSNTVGRIRAGYLANLVVCDDELAVHGVVRDGKLEMHPQPTFP